MAKKKKIEIDYDLVLANLKRKHGWGDGIDDMIPKFEQDDEYFPGSTTNEKYEENFQRFLYDDQFGYREYSDEENVPDDDFQRGESNTKNAPLFP